MEEDFDYWVSTDEVFGTCVAEPSSEYGQADGVDLAAYTPFTHRIIGCAMRVHAILGTGFPEIIYQRALGIELAREEM